MTARRKMAWTFLSLSMLVFVAALAYRWADRSGRFDLREIRIGGIRAADSSMVVCRLAPLFGKSLASIEPNAVAESLEELSFVRSAAVQRSWPSTLSISIELYQPVALLRSGDLSAPVSADCRTLPQTFASDSLPVVQIMPGANREMLADLTEWICANGFPDSASKALLGENGVTLVLQTGTRVMLGSGRLDNRWSRYMAMPRNALMPGRCRLIDLRFDGQAVLREGRET